VGALLGCGAHVSRLHRSAAGSYTEEQSITLEELEAEREQGEAESLDRHLLPVDSPVATLAALALPESSSHYFRLGNPVMDAGVYRTGQEGDMVRVFCESGQFVGLGVLEEGRVAPKRLIASPR